MDGRIENDRPMTAAILRFVYGWACRVSREVKMFYVRAIHLCIETDEIDVSRAILTTIFAMAASRSIPRGSEVERRYLQLQELIFRNFDFRMEYDFDGEGSGSTPAIESRSISPYIKLVHEQAMILIDSSQADEYQYPPNPFSCPDMINCLFHLDVKYGVWTPVNGN